MNLKCSVMQELAPGARAVLNRFSEILLRRARVSGIPVPNVTSGGMDGEFLVCPCVRPILGVSDAAYAASDSHGTFTGVYSVR